jgi:hypothetical protein
MLPLSSKARTGLISLAEQRLRLADLYCFGIAALEMQREIGRLMSVAPSPVFSVDGYK